MPLQIPALNAVLLAAALTASAAAVESGTCDVDRQAVAEQAAMIGIQMSDDIEPVSRSDDGMKFGAVAEALGVEGEVVTLLLIGRDGAVADQVVLCGEPFGYFEATALPWSQSFRFSAVAGGAGPRYRGYIVTVKFRFR